MNLASAFLQLLKVECFSGVGTGVVLVVMEVTDAPHGLTEGKVVIVHLLQMVEEWEEAPEGN